MQINNLIEPNNNEGVGHEKSKRLFFERFYGFSESEFIVNESASIEQKDRECVLPSQLRRCQFERCSTPIRTSSISRRLMSP